MDLGLVPALIYSKTPLKMKSLQTQQTPNPEAQDPEFVPPVIFCKRAK